MKNFSACQLWQGLRSEPKEAAFARCRIREVLDADATQSGAADVAAAVGVGQLLLGLRTSGYKGCFK